MNFSSRSPSPKSSERGFSMIELMVANAIFLISMTGIAAMQTTAIGGFQYSNDLVTATNLATSTIEELQMTNFDTVVTGSQFFDRRGANLANATDSFFEVISTVTIPPGVATYKDVEVQAVWGQNSDYFGSRKVRRTSLMARVRQR